MAIYKDDKASCEQVIEAQQRLVILGLTSGTSGNVSVRIDTGRLAFQFVVPYLRTSIPTESGTNTESGLGDVLGHLDLVKRGGIEGIEDLATGGKDILARLLFLLQKLPQLAHVVFAEFGFEYREPTGMDFYLVGNLHRLFLVGIYKIFRTCALSAGTTSSSNQWRCFNHRVILGLGCGNGTNPGGSASM